MTDGLDQTARTQVQAMIQAALTSRSQSNTGLTRGGLVQFYDTTSRIATVLIDGDVTPVPVQNAMTWDPLEGQRVLVQFQEPMGAIIIGLAGTRVDPPPPAPYVPPVQGLRLNVLGGVVESDYTPGSTVTIPCGSFTAPQDGYGTVVLQIQGRFNSGGTEDINMSSPTSDLVFDGGSAARNIAAEPVRTNLTAIGISPFKSAGAAWNPQAMVTVGSGSATWHFNFYALLVLFAPTDHIL